MSAQTGVSVSILWLHEECSESGLPAMTSASVTKPYSLRVRVCGGAASRSSVCRTWTWAFSFSIAPNGRTTDIEADCGEVEFGGSGLTASD